jgi:hypothetical protein
VSGEYRDAPGTRSDTAALIFWLLLIVAAVSAGLILATITGSPR